MPKKITFLDPIGQMSGKFAPTNVKPRAFQNGRWIGAKMLTSGAYATNGIPRSNWQIRTKGRTTPYTASELAQMDKFAAVSRAVRRVMMSPQELVQAQAEFAAQSTYKRLRTYLWNREWSNYQG